MHISKKKKNGKYYEMFSIFLRNSIKVDKTLKIIINIYFGTRNKKLKHNYKIVHVRKTTN